MRVNVKMKIPNRIRVGILKLGLLSVVAAIGAGCTSGQDRMPLIVAVPARQMSKAPFVIAADQGLYEKHGLDVELWLGEPAFEGGVKTHLRLWTSVRMLLGLEEAPEPDITTDGYTPRMLDQMKDPGAPRLIALGSTDCSLHFYVIARPEIKSLEELKGKRLGLNSDVSTSNFAGLLMIQRMGWDRVQDISIMIPGRMEDLRKGRVDGIVGNDGDLEAAQREGFPVLEHTQDWNERVAGTSIMVTREWLQDPMHREAVRRFLMATAEAVALFHQRPELVVEVLMKWEGMDREIAESRYKRTDYIPRKPYPCVEGIENTMRLHDSNEMRRYQPEDFYDDSFMRELDESGFLDGLYK